MSESKGKILFVILAVLLLLFGGGTMLYPALNGLLVERTMHRDSEDFLLLLEEDAERTAEENSHVIPEEPESEKSNVPEQYSQLWLDMKAYNAAIFREGQKGLSDPSAYEDVCFRLSDYGLDSEVFGVLSIPKLNLQMPIYMGATKENMAAGAAGHGADQSAYRWQRYQLCPCRTSGMERRGIFSVHQPAGTGRYRHCYQSLGDAELQSIRSEGDIAQ